MNNRAYTNSTQQVKITQIMTEQINQPQRRETDPVQRTQR